MLVRYIHIHIRISAVCRNATEMAFFNCKGAETQRETTTQFLCESRKQQKCVSAERFLLFHQLHPRCLLVDDDEPAGQQTTAEEAIDRRRCRLEE